MIVVDASVAVQWVLPESGSEAANELLLEDMSAPTFWLLEAANVLWRRQRRGEMSAGQAISRFNELLNAPIASLAIEPYIDKALQLATELGHSVHDCLYLAAAIQHGTHVVTADRRFAAIAVRPDFAGRVRLLGA